MDATTNGDRLLRQLYTRAYNLEKERRTALEERFPPWYVCPESRRHRLDTVLWTVGCVGALFAAVRLHTAGMIGFLTFFALIMGIVSSLEAATSGLLERRRVWLKAHPFHSFRSPASRDSERLRLTDRFVVLRAVLEEMPDRLTLDEIAELQAFLPKNQVEFLRDEAFWAKRMGVFSERYVRLCSRSPGVHRGDPPVLAP